MSKSYLQDQQWLEARFARVHHQIERFHDDISRRLKGLQKEKAFPKRKHETWEEFLVEVNKDYQRRLQEKARDQEERFIPTVINEEVEELVNQEEEPTNEVIEAITCAPELYNEDNYLPLDSRYVSMSMSSRFYFDVSDDECLIEDVENSMEELDDNTCKESIVLVMENEDDGEEPQLQEGDLEVEVDCDFKDDVPQESYILGVQFLNELKEFHKNLYVKVDEESYFLETEKSSISHFSSVVFVSYSQVLERSLKQSYLYEATFDPYAKGVKMDGLLPRLIFDPGGEFDTKVTIHSTPYTNADLRTNRF